MAGGIDIFHHVGLIASTMEAVVAWYETLGFGFTPLSMPRIALAPGGEPESLGVGNRCAIFSDTYLEVLGFVDKPKWDSLRKDQIGPYNIEPALARYEGLHVVHFGTDDIAAARQRLSAEGVACSDIKPFQRMVDTPDGQRLMQARTMFYLEGSDLPSLTQLAQHVTPERIFQPRYMTHRNGARAVTEVIACDRSPEQLAGRYARCAGGTVATRNKLHVVEFGRSRIVVVGPEELGAVIPGAQPPMLPCLVGFTVATNSVAKAGGILRAANVPFIEHGGRVIVGAGDACGSAVLFEAEGASRN